MEDNLNKVKFNHFVAKTKILIITVTDKEYCNVKSIINDQETFIIDNYTYTFGHVGSYDVVLGKNAYMGICDTIITINHYCKYMQIDYVFMLGVCAGISSKVNLKDVILANKVIAYEKQKITESRFFKKIQRIQRADIYNPGNLYRSISSLVLKEEFNFKVYKGMVLSGEKLLNSSRVKKELLKCYPEAIGLDMEGTGLGAACLNIGVKDWIFIKGISDRGSKKKGSENQDEAMKNVLTLFKFIMQQKNFFNIAKGNVLISGSYVYGDKNTSKVETFSNQLTKSLIKNGLKVVTGYGLCVGPAVVSGAYDIAKTMDINISDCLESYPFPRVQNEDLKKFLQSIKSENRKLMTKEIKYSIFIYGKKINECGKEIQATGMLEEFYNSKGKAYVIPIGATGYMAEHLWKIVKNEFELYYPDANNTTIALFDKLNDKKLSNTDLIQNIIDFINSL